MSVWVLATWGGNMKKRRTSNSAGWSLKKRKVNMCRMSQTLKPSVTNGAMEVRGRKKREGVQQCFGQSVPGETGTEEEKIVWSCTRVVESS